MVRHIIIIALLSAAFVIIQAVIDAKSDPGAKLARELGLDVGITFNSSPKFSTKTGPQSNVADENFRAKLEQMIPKWKSNPGEALREIDSLMEHFHESNPGKTTYDLHWYKVFSLRALNRYVEAIVEAKTLQRICSSIPGCLPEQAAKLIDQTKSAMNLGGHYAVLGVQPGASRIDIKRAYRKLSLLLHPDKNTHLDEASQNYLKDLLVKVQNSYNVIMKQPS